MWDQHNVPEDNILLMNRPISLRLTFVLASLTIMAACSPQFYPGGERLHTPEVTERHLATSDLVELPLRKWPARTGTPAAVVIALHGFNDYSLAFEEPANWWSENGLTIYAYDQRGFGAAPHHGYWSSTETMAADLDDAIKAVHNLHPNVPLYILGSSMGGAVILTALGDRPTAPKELVSGVILVGPAVWGAHAMNPILPFLLRLGAHTIPANHLTGQGLRIKPSDNIPMLRVLGRDPLIIKSTRIDTLYGLTNLMGVALVSAVNLDKPVLVLGAANDELVPSDAHEALLHSLSSETTAVTYPNGWHMLLRDMQAEIVWKDILSWINNRGAPLPSDAERQSISFKKECVSLCQ
jgi:acylglycerol lipase